jgi:hypothetical protein
MKTNVLVFVILATSLFYIACNPSKNNKEMIAGKPDSATMAEMKKPVLKYDDRGNIIERKDVMFLPNGRIGNRNFYTYKFDEKNNRLQEVSLTFDTTNRRITKTVCDFTYNELNQKVQTIFASYDAADNELSWVKNVLKYDKNGFEIEDTQYIKDGSKLTSMQRVRDEQGRIFEEIYYSYNPDGSVKETKGIQYDANGRVLKTY